MELRINKYKKEIARLRARVAELEAGQKIPSLLVSHPESMASILGDVDPTTPAYDRSAAMKAFWSKRKAAKAAAP
jgi:hypothetical protein